LLAELATEDESYGNAIGLLAIHGTICHADAIAIAYGGRKSIAGSHSQIVALLVAALGDQFPKADRKRLAQVVSQKDAMAYHGRYVPLGDAIPVLKAAQRFANWAERMFEQRP
jgi:hypothetical protein